MAASLLSVVKSVEMKRSSDAMSEISESGTTTSGCTSRWDSREDLRDLVTRLGLKDVSELYQERFRVDRGKLEKMLICNNEAPFPADVFFERVMEDTATIITWPNKLKIGAKSKKDPHVRIAGKPEDVRAAKERISTVLSPRCHRVTMKMEVSYTDHSHIIGKGGASIKRVMEETKCHVHFPDSNRNNPNEKSNQVSISGAIDGVERARSRVRELIPLIFGFELPIMSQNVDLNAPYIAKVQEQYKVQVMFKTRPKLHATLVLVKGVEWEAYEVKHATLLLMEFMCENLASQTSVQMSMEISPHHHPVVLGKNHSNLKAIMQATSCQIMFPDAHDPNIPILKKSNVTITGNIHNVYKARQLLMGSLPLIIIFDLPDDSTFLRIKPDQISEIQTTCDVMITIRQKAKGTVKACVIKGIEKQATDIYRARNLILGIDEAPIQADIPKSYCMPISAPATSQSELLTPTTINPPPISPLLSPNWSYPNPTYQQGPSFVAMTQQPTFFSNMPNMMQGNNYGYQSPNVNQAETAGDGRKAYSSCFGTANSLSATPSHRAVSPRNPTSQRNYQEVQPNYNQYTGIELSSILSEMNNPGQFHGPTLNKKAPQSPSFPTYEYESKKIAAVKAMQAKPSPGQIRVPHNSWSGYGVSQTSPGGFLMERFSRQEDDIFTSYASPRHQASESPSTSSPSAVLNTSNLLDHTPSHIWNRITNIPGNYHDLPSLLTAIKMDHYIPIFKQHEIDLTVFSTLTDQDLVGIGITAFGARKRMLLAISEINNRNSPFSPAPGAERRSNNSTNSNY